MHDGTRGTHTQIKNIQDASDHQTLPGTVARAGNRWAIQASSGHTTSICRER
jgi:hypothetical protein